MNSYCDNYISFHRNQLITHKLQNVTINLNKGKKMKKTLLLTSALVSGLTLASVSNAEIKGSMKFGYGASDAPSNDATAPGTQGFMRETQIDMSTKGELDNGMTFSAGASFEAEGDDTNATGIDFSEGTFIQFGMGDTTIHFGQDKFTNLDDSATPTTGSALDTIADIVGTSYSRNPSSPYSSFGVGVSQKTPVGEISLLYVPQNGDKGSEGATGDHTATDIDGGAAYEVKFKGNFGIDGLNVVAGLNDREKDVDANYVPRDGKGQVYGASYNFGQFAVGASFMEDENQNGTTTENTEYGVTFAASDKLSIGLAMLKHESSALTSDEDTKLLTVGYNLGPIALEINYADVENKGGTADADTTGVSVNTSVKF